MALRDTRTASLRLWGRIALLVAILVAAGVYIDKGVLPNIVPKNFGVVDEGTIYRSGKLTPNAIRKVVEEHGIRTIVDFGAFERGSREEDLQQRTADALGVVRYRFDLYGDATGNPNSYVQALHLMNDPENQPVLIHCGAGSERTGCAVVLHREINQGAAREDTMAETRKFKHSDRRNPKLLQVLDRWAGPIEEAYRNGGNVEGADPLPTVQPENPDVLAERRRRDAAEATRP